MKWLLQILQWYYRETPVIAEGNDANELRTGTPQLVRRYQINVSKNGKHVFATALDRHYRQHDIAKLITLFRVVFPDCKLIVTASQTFGVELGDVIEKALVEEIEVVEEQQVQEET